MQQGPPQHGYPPTRRPGGGRLSTAVGVALSLALIGALVVFGIATGKKKGGGDAACKEAATDASHKISEIVSKSADDFESLEGEERKVESVVEAARKRCLAARSANTEAILTKVLEQPRKNATAVFETQDVRREQDPDVAKRGKKPTQSTWDGSVRVVEAYVKANLKDPDSYKHVGTVITADGPTWKVETSYRASNSFGAKVLESQTFWLQGGEIVRTSR